MDKYEIECMIGKGSFSRVYKAKSKEDNEIVILKKINLEKTDTPKHKTDCLQEVVLLQQLNHPNVIRYLTSYVDIKHLNIIFEYANSGDLDKLIKRFTEKRRLFPEKTVWKIFVQIASGLNHLHSQRIMHRDIKPANILITKDEIVKLGDLGLGRYFSRAEEKVNSVVGTVYYMSPERIMHKSYTFSSDIWSLGCVLHEMAALLPAFHVRRGSNLYMVVRKIENADYDPIPSPIYSKQLNDLKKQCLQIDQTMRPDISCVYDLASNMNAQFNPN